MDLTRRSLLRLAALTPLATLLGGLPKAAEAILVTPAKVEIVQALPLDDVRSPLFLDVVLRRGDRVLERWTTTPFAGLDVRHFSRPAPEEEYRYLAPEEAYRHLGFTFSPRFEVVRRDPR